MRKISIIIMFFVMITTMSLMFETSVEAAPSSGMSQVTIDGSTGGSRPSVGSGTSSSSTSIPSSGSSSSGSTTASGSGSSSSGGLLGDIFEMGESWTETGKDNAEGTMDSTSMKNVADSLYNALLAIALVVALVVGGILGIQFMTAGVNKRVQVKESLFPYMISCVVVFGSLGIWKLVVLVVKQI